MKTRREADHWRQVPVVGRLEGVDVVDTVVTRHYNRQVVALHEAPGDEGTCHSAVAIRKGMDLDLHKPVVVPRRHQKGVVNVGLGTPGTCPQPLQAVKYGRCQLLPTENAAHTLMPGGEPWVGLISSG